MRKRKIEAAKKYIDHRGSFRVCLGTTPELLDVESKDASEKDDSRFDRMSSWFWPERRVSLLSSIVGLPVVMAEEE
jgi:hypothetical protein